MSYRLQRITTVPNSPMRILVSQPDGKDAGLNLGGSFYFMPAGQDGDTYDVSDHAAAVIMGDPGLAPHFRCLPEWRPQVMDVPPTPAPVDVAAEPDPIVEAAPMADGPAALGQTTGPRRRKRRGDQG